MNRMLSILSYVGMALVFGALAVRIYGKPEWSQYAIYASWAGLALVLLYTTGTPGWVSSRASACSSASAS